MHGHVHLNKDPWTKTDRSRTRQRRTREKGGIPDQFGPGPTTFKKVGTDADRVVRGLSCPLIPRPKRKSTVRKVPLDLNLRFGLSHSKVQHFVISTLLPTLTVKA